jgi:hypothetical protein
MTMTASNGDLPLKVRYEHFSGWSDWTPCQSAAVEGEALAINLGHASRDMIPLHVIRGVIEVRPNNESE